MRDFVSEEIATRGKAGAALDEQTALGMDSARPRLQTPDAPELFPVRCGLKNVNGRFRVAHGLFALKLLRPHAILELGRHRTGRAREWGGEVIDEMLGL